MEMREYYNLDTNVKSFFTNTRVLNALSRSNIETLWDLYCVGEDFLCKSNNIGTLSRKIIHEAYQYLESLYNLEFDYVEVYKILRPYLKRKILVSVNSDNQYLGEVITLEKLLWLSNNESLSDRDRINTNAVIKYLTDNLVKINTDDTTFLSLKSIEVFVDKNPFDTISPTIARFNDDKEAYDTLIDIIKSIGNPKSDMFMMYYGIFQKRSTLEAIGQKYGLTRERVRQLNVKTYQKVTTKLDGLRYKIINYFQNEYYIPFENPLLLIYCEYLKDIGLYIKDKILDENIYTLPNYQDNLHYYIQQIEDEIESSGLYQFDENDKNAKMFQKLLSKKYKINNGIIYGKNTLVSSVPKIMEDIGKSINLNSNNDTELIYNLLESKYNIKNEYHDARNLERVLAGTCVLLDNRTYIHEKYIKRVENIEEIFKYIEESKITNAQKIFEEYRTLWESIGIYSHIGVYGYIKYFYPEKYNYGGRSFLISVIGENSTWGGEVIDRIKKYNRPVSFNEMHRDYPALSDTIWVNLENIFSDLIFWGDNCYYCISSLELSSQKKNMITVYMYNNKIVTDKDLFMFIFEHDKDLLEMYNISNEKQLQKLINVNLGDVIHFNSSNSTFYI